jgi:hypothetical protein
MRLLQKDLIIDNVRISNIWTLGTASGCFSNDACGFLPFTAAFHGVHFWKSVHSPRDFCLFAANA